MADRYGVEYEFKNFDDSKIIDRYVPNVDKLNKLLIFKSFAAIGFEPMTVEHESTEITRLLHTA